MYNGKAGHWIANSPSSAISIVGAYTPAYAVFADCTLQSDGFTAQYFWSGGSKSIDYLSGFGCNSQGYGYGTGINQSFGPSSYFGWGVTCSLKSLCWTSSSAGAVLGVYGVRLTAEEDSGPTVVAEGSNNLWYQDGHWVRGGGWPVGFNATDPSGVCGTDLLINGQFTGTDSSNDSSPDTSSFTQCWSGVDVVGTLDTDSYGNGPLSITYAARNAADVAVWPANTLNVDNTPVSLSLSTPDDADPNVWVNHSVKVVAAASAGPSGLGGTNCSTNQGPSYDYPAGGIELSGTGVWKVSCWSWNNALDVNGNRATSPTESTTLHIDETPPKVAFEPVNPADPQAITVDTSDDQSGVAGGQIQMRPASGGTWDSLATGFDGSHLLARFDDAILAPGSWLVDAHSCDNAGNCADAEETLTLPIRSASVSTVGFVTTADPTGHGSACSHIRTRGHRHQRKRCAKAQPVFTTQGQTSFGKSAQLRGTLTTARGTPIADARIVVLTAPQNGLSQYSVAASVTTNSAGVWTLTLPPGPSRLIDAVYNGSPTTQPSQGWAKLNVLASVSVLRVWPRHVRWGGEVHVEAQLLGGYLPPEGALVRLRLGYGNAKITYGVQEHVGGNGIFEVTNKFGPGPAGLVLQYWLQECTLPEGDYPFAPACGPRDDVMVGRRG